MGLPLLIEAVFALVLFRNLIIIKISYDLGLHRPGRHKIPWRSAQYWPCP